MKYFTTLVLLLLLITSVSVSQFSEHYAGSLTGVIASSVAWGDYDNDGKLDFIYTGVDAGNNYVAKIYHNTGSGFTEVYPGSLAGVENGSVAWGDYDNDGKLDILLTGDNNTGFVTKIYHNTGTGFTEVYPGSLDEVSSGSVAWGDFDNDGKLDILLSGSDGGDNVTKIYHNTGSGFTEVFAGALTGVDYSSVAWGDYDNDGKLDILLTGYHSAVPVTKIYHNTGNGFTEVFAGTLTGVGRGSAAWGDYDNDGKLDILLTGYSGSNYVTKIYHNDGNGFSEVYAGSLTGEWESNAAWGDFDNDGKLDILLTGNNNGVSYSQIYHNTGSGFTEEFGGNITAMSYGSIAWGDYDGDGKLDILATGWDNSHAFLAQIYHNDGATADTPPGTASNLGSSVTNGEVTLHWNHATDNETPVNGLSYSIRIGDNVQEINRLSPMADITTGTRLLPKLGNTNQDTSWIIQDLPNGTYHWSVQAVDNAYEGGAFATEATFQVVAFRFSFTALNGTITTNPEHDAYDSNSTVQLTATPATGYHFVNWSGDGSDSTNPLLVKMNADKNITANFALNTYTLNVSSTHGSVTKDPDQAVYDSNSTVQLTAVPATGYYFVNWSGDGSDSTNPLLVTMNANKNITANFAINTYTINVVATNGSVTKNPDLASYDSNSTVQLKATPVSGYHFIGWSGDLNGSANPDTITLNANKNITANFSINVFSLSVQNKWNIVSVPFKRATIAKRDLFSTSISGAFAYEASYAAKDTLKPGVGYWLKFGSDQIVPWQGSDSLTIDTIAVTAGWNLIGSLSSPIAASAVGSIPSGITTSQFFEYSDTYLDADSIIPGKGYWVKTSSAGQLIFAVPNTTTAANKIRIVPITEKPPAAPESDGVAELPKTFGLEQNYPNPFNPSTVVRYQLPKDSWVTLEVYNTLGEKVMTLLDGMESAGYKSVTLNANNLPSGLYFYRLNAGTFTQVKKMLLMK